VSRADDLAAVLGDTAHQADEAPRSGKIMTFGPSRSAVRSAKLILKLRDRLGEVGMAGVRSGRRERTADKRPVPTHDYDVDHHGDSADRGVVDPYLRMFGHPGLHVVDGSVLSANPGVNPALTITAQAERAMALWPNNGEDDTCPPIGTEYRHVTPIMPKRPTVPAHAPAALRLPVAEAS